MQFSLGNLHPAFGIPLIIQLNESAKKDSTVILSIEYETSPNASGLQWLPPTQTEGKDHPYLFSQFQAIHCRSGLPCQDSPSVKATYSAEITVPKPLVCLMSAISTGQKENENSVTFSFHQKVPIPVKEQQFNLNRDLLFL